MTGRIHSFESMGAVDGPGLRFVIFMQGCPLRCAYCHNPDSWEFGKGEEKTVEQCFNEIVKYKNYFGEKGGVTVSGGEPLCQINFVIELFRKLKELNIHTCIDTSGITFDKNNSAVVQKFEELMQLTDLVLLDLKHINNNQHINLTGKSNQNPQDFARFLSAINKPVWIRYVLVPEINTQLEYLNQTKEFLNQLNNIEKIEVLPYHTMGVVKYEKLGIPYRLKDLRTPTKEEVELAKNILNNN
ncbi:MAG: pyruvate formate lyase-activating protein [Clostridia bacterium]|nr:pyruvate formate lyase-activating protein [Clostridia bacterium]